MQKSDIFIADAHKEGKRAHAGLRDMTALMSDVELRHVVGYYASFPYIMGRGMREVCIYRC
jgi:hypothetical protein